MQTSKWWEQNENMGWVRRAEILPLPYLPSSITASLFFIILLILSLICDISSWNYSPLPVSREKIERDCDGKLISFQMHWRRYQKIILSNLDYIWFVENVEWISKMFFPQHCSLSVVGSIVNREPFMSNENFSSKMKLSVYYYVIPRDMHT